MPGELGSEYGPEAPLGPSPRHWLPLDPAASSLLTPPQPLHFLCCSLEHTEAVDKFFSLLCQGRSKADQWIRARGPKEPAVLPPSFDLHRDTPDLFILVKKKKKEMKKEQPTLHCIGLTHKLSYHGLPACCRVFRLLLTCLTPGFSLG